MNDMDSISLEQVLHGYSDGHRLLKSSKVLSKQSQREMLVQSDMSGPSMTDEYKEYLSGYKLLGDEYFVFAKTWFAPEMKRPGCVWTHSLLISFEELEKIYDIRLLLSLFKRPTGDENYDYCEKIVLKHRHRTQDNNERYHTDLLKKILFIIFNGSEGLKPCVLSTNGPVKYSNDILRLWSLLWPKAKLEFSFSTGSLSPRRINNEPFLLQMSPVKIRRQFLRTSSELKVIDDVPYEGNYPQWITSVSEKMISGQKDYLKKTMFDCGVPESTPIDDFKQIIEVDLYKRDLYSKKYNPDEIFNEVFKFYPSNTEGSLVKSILFNLNILDQYNLESAEEFLINKRILLRGVVG